MIIIQGGIKSRGKNEEKLLEPKTPFPSCSETTWKRRAKDGQPGLEVAGNRDSSVGPDDFADPVCVVGNLGVVAKVTSQNTPFGPG